MHILRINGRVFKAVDFTNCAECATYVELSGCQTCRDGSMLRELPVQGCKGYTLVELPDPGSTCKACAVRCSDISCRAVNEAFNTHCGRGVQFVDVQSISDTEYTDWPDNPKGDVEVPEGPAPEAPTIWPDGDSPVHTPELPVHSKYLHKAFAYSHVYKFLSHLQQELKDVEFDSFVCTGVSGLLMAAPIALLMNKGLTVVRKAKEHGHSKELIEGAVPKRYLIIDDFVASGNTVARVLCAMQDSNVFKESECIGACFYAARPDSEYYMETLRWCNTGRVIVTLSE